MNTMYFRLKNGPIVVELTYVLFYYPSTTINLLYVFVNLYKHA